MKWRNPSKEDVSTIKSRFVIREILITLLVLAFDFMIISLVVFTVVNYFDLFTIICDLFLLYLIYIFTKSAVKTISSLINFYRSKMSLVDCVLSEVSVNRIGLLNNSNVTLTTEDGTTYRTSYSSAFTTRAYQGRHAFLVDFGKNGKDFELVLL